MTTCKQGWLNLKSTNLGNLKLNDKIENAMLKVQIRYNNEKKIIEALRGEGEYIGGIINKILSI